MLPLATEWESVLVIRTYVHHLLECTFLLYLPAAGGADGKGWEVGVGEQPPSRTFRLLEQICPHRQKAPRGQDVTPRSHRHPWVRQASWEPWAAAPFPREEVSGIIHRAGPCCQHLSGLDSSRCCGL